MPSIRNTTKLPIAVPLPGGKKLRLGPLQAGQVTPKALDHPPLKKLLEAGRIELTDDGRPSGEAASSSNRPSGGQNPGGSGIRHVGDR